MEKLITGDPPVLIFVGVRDSVVALDDRTGEEVWRAKLRSLDYVTVLWDGEALIAANAGEVWRIDPGSGEIIWHNELKGMGRGVVTLASIRRPGITGDSRLAEERRRRDGAAAAGS